MYSSCWAAYWVPGASKDDAKQLLTLKHIDLVPVGEVSGDDQLLYSHTCPKTHTASLHACSVTNPRNAVEC